MQQKIKLATSLGVLSLRFSRRGLQELSLPPVFSPVQPSTMLPDMPWRQSLQLLLSYAAGEAVDLSLIPIDFSGLTEFSQKVYDATREVPLGRVCSYREIAVRIGRPGAARAVGGALSRNPIALVIPCHRVIAANGSLGGFSGPGSIPQKQQLLDHERRSVSRE
jgi:methylated-DNA-[protein]-cysteine S-methyltransferase